MNASRRTTLELGATGLIGAAGLSVPLGATLQAKSVSRLARANMPVPFRAAFTRPPVLSPIRTHVDTDGVPTQQHTVFARAGPAGIVPGLTTPVIGYNGLLPGPTISVDQGT